MLVGDLKDLGTLKVDTRSNRKIVQELTLTEKVAKGSQLVSPPPPPAFFFFCHTKESSFPKAFGMGWH